MLHVAVFTSFTLLYNVHKYINIFWIPTRKVGKKPLPAPRSNSLRSISSKPQWNPTCGRFATRNSIGQAFNGAGMAENDPSSLWQATPGHARLRFGKLPSSLKLRRTSRRGTPVGKPPYPHRPEPTGRHPQNPRSLSAVASYLEMNRLALLYISWYWIFNDIKKLLAWKRR